MIGWQTTHEVCKGPSELGTAWSDILYSKSTYSFVLIVIYPFNTAKHFLFKENYWNIYFTMIVIPIKNLVSPNVGDFHELGGWILNKLLQL